nr:hypothetical protein [Tanacetum cinerariifolium]
YIKVSKSAQDRDLVWEEADSETMPKRKSMKKAFQDMMHGLGEVNLSHAYYNGSRISKDNEDPSWKFQDQENLKDIFIVESALEDFIIL